MKTMVAIVVCSLIATFSMAQSQYETILNEIVNSSTVKEYFGEGKVVLAAQKHYGKFSKAEKKLTTGSLILKGKQDAFMRDLKKFLFVEKIEIDGKEAMVILLAPSKLSTFAIRVKFK